MRIGSREFDLSNPIIMGIINVTPDSFSDGGLYFDPDKAADHALRLIDEGADILDVGGESTRPGSLPVDAEQELNRVLPVIQRIRRTSDIPVSIDTQKALVARQAVQSGADMINDVSAGLNDPSMFRTASELKLPICLMHMKGTPSDMQLDPTYSDLLGQIREFLRERIEAAEKVGIASHNIIIDPGIGFGKTADDNVNIILNIKHFASLGKPVLIGPSRKSFIGNLLNYDVDERLEPTLATLGKSYENGARLFRVHDVAPTRRYLEMSKLLLDASPL